MCKDESYPDFETSSLKKRDIRKIEHCSEFSCTLPNDLKEVVNIWQSITIESTQIRKGHVIVIFTEDCPIFYVWEFLIVRNDHDFIVIAKKVLDCHLDEKLRYILYLMKLIMNGAF